MTAELNVTVQDCPSFPVPNETTLRAKDVSVLPRLAEGKHG